MKRKGFTLVELLVVIAIIALLMGILMPALSRVRQLAFRLICGTNLKGIGNAMLVYANDYDNQFPRAGGPDAQWYRGSVVWDAGSSMEAYSAGRTPRATITSSFYLLVKYAEVTPKSFLCKGDSNVKEFEPGNDKDLIQLWDFGNKGYECCSYSYHIPYCKYPITTTSDPGMAIAADPTPWVDGARTEDMWNNFDPDGDKEQKMLGNSIVHQEEGQNVLFADIHVEFEKVSFCGINEDNIYTLQTIRTDIRKGARPSPSNYNPYNRSDSVLVDDRQAPPKSSCFPGNTDVWIDGKLAKITEVCEGQTIGKPGNIMQTLCSKQIEKVQEHEGSFECRDIYLKNGNCISVVSAHRFMLNCGIWVSAHYLRSGMKLMSLNGPVCITKVQVRNVPFEGKVYNLKVQNGEQYFVGVDGIVVRDW
jgi:prepilin-type N-terminal cleavage/methylation domain-containing protein